MSRDREKRKGTYFFWSDWRASECAGLTYAAKGLWIDLLAVMAEKTPQGVIAGDLESLAEALGFVGPLGQAWAGAYAPLVDELEAKRVFSRGHEVDADLPADAIVNRRMYREWSKAESVSEDRRRAAHIRWGRERGGEVGSVSMDDVRAEVYGGACKIDAKRCKGDANAMHDESAESPGNKGDLEILENSGDAKKCYTPTQPTQTQPNPTQPMGVQGVPQRVGQIVALTQAPGGKQVYERIVFLTGDCRGPRARWWNDAVNAFRRAGHLSALVEHCEYLERKGGGITSPSRYLVKRVLTSSRELKVKLKDPPEERAV